MHWTLLVLLLVLLCLTIRHLLDQHHHSYFCTYSWAIAHFIKVKEKQQPTVVGSISENTSFPSHLVAVLFLGGSISSQIDITPISPLLIGNLGQYYLSYHFIKVRWKYSNLNKIRPWFNKTRINFKKGRFSENSVFLKS